MSSFDDFMRLYDELRAELGLGPCFHQAELLDLELADQHLDRLDPGDELWLALIAAYEELGAIEDHSLLDSRLSDSRRAEGADGYAFVYLSRRGRLCSKAGGAFEANSCVLLGRADCRALAARLRELAEVCVAPKKPGVWHVQRAEDYVEARTTPTCAELTPTYARQLADELEAVSESAPEESPPLDHGRS